MVYMYTYDVSTHTEAVRATHVVACNMCIHTHTHTYIHTRKCVSTHVGSVLLHTLLHVIFAYTYTYIYIHTHAGSVLLHTLLHIKFAYIHIHIHTHAGSPCYRRRDFNPKKKHTYTHTYMHTYTRSYITI
jgi:hypothetical protein